MVALIDELLEAGSRNETSIPFRPDHGHDLLNDAALKTQAGYPLVGRLRGLAELRGVIAALS
jgi:mannonate dehydratase